MRRRHISAAGVIALIIVAIAVAASLVTVRFENVSPRNDLSERRVAISYVVHDPILIEGNTGFTNESGVVWGSGTSSDPYVIEGWEIGWFPSIGIGIRNASAHFVIQDCYVHHGASGVGNYSAIFLYSCSNGTIRDCRCSNDHLGIVFGFSNNCSLASNNCSNNHNGILLADSRDNILANNTCSSNTEYGIWLYPSDANSLIDNTCSNNTHGIYLKSSNRNSLTNNTCFSNSRQGIDLEYSDGNSLVDNTCYSNLCDGIQLLYSFSNILVGNTCSSNILVGIMLFSSDNCSLSNSRCFSNSEGIGLDSTHGSNLTNNVCNDNTDGIGLSYVCHNTLINNTCSSNNGFGIRLSNSISNVLVSNNCSGNLQYGLTIDVASSGNVIWCNVFSHNNGAVDTYSSSHIQAFDSGTGNWWNTSSGYGNFWSDWTTPDVDGNGIVDLPYNISGSAGAKDYYPLTTTPAEPIPEFGIMPFVVTVMLAAFILAREGRRRKA